MKKKKNEKMKEEIKTKKKGERDGARDSARFGHVSEHHFTGLRINMRI